MDDDLVYTGRLQPRKEDVPPEPIPESPNVSLRKRLDVLLRDHVTDDVMKDLLLDALVAEKPVWVNCPHCKKKLQAPVANVKDRVWAIKELETLANGQPAQHVKTEVTVRQGIAVEEMTDEELEALAKGEK